MIVHQAIYGDRSGSYGLLKTSLTDIQLAKRICNVTDLLDRPSSGHLSQPVFRGFAFDNSYIFIKSFPDTSPGVRSGRVLSHTLIVEQGDLQHLNDLGRLFSYFLSKPEKDPELDAIVIEDGDSGPAEIILHTSREAAAINGLLDHSSYNNTLVWIGEDGYLSLITQIWSHLSGDLRAKVKLGVGFSPPKVDTQALNILYVMEEYENKWKTVDYCIIGKESNGTLQSMSSLLLAGYRDDSKPLSDLIGTFGIVPTEIEDFKYLETAVDTYRNLSPTIAFNRLIVFCDLISQYSPNQEIAKAEKNKLLKEIISRIDLASAKQILVLKNSEWKGFFNAQKLIGEHIDNWVAKYIFNLEVDESVTNVITEASNPENKALWWKKAVLDGLKTALGNWKPTYAIVVWKWFAENHNLVKILENLIPDNIQVETDLVGYWPKPERELSREIQLFAQDRKWLTLHGLSTLQLHNPEQSINIQLEIDTDPEHSAALQRMSELINDEEFLEIAVKIGESRLVTIAGENAARTPSLLGQLDVRNIIWRQIWLKAMEHGNKPWDGIKNPIAVLFALLEEVLNGAAVDSELLLILSNSDYNDLSRFKRRAEVWQHLNGRVKLGFLSASTLGCIRLLNDKKISINELEEEIRIHLARIDIIKRVVEDQTINVSIKIQLFEELSTLRENEVLMLLNTVRFSSGESQRLGKLVLRSRWKRAAGIIAKNISSRVDLKPALTECKSLLGFFDRLKLSFSGDLSEAISKEEWWSALTEQCYTKYPNGPAHMGLWERAGGKNYDLPTKGTGREIWVNAISKVRNGITDVDVQKLIQEMLKDYHSSDELKQLIKTSGKI